MVIYQKIGIKTYHAHKVFDFMTINKIPHLLRGFRIFQQFVDTPQSQISFCEHIKSENLVCKYINKISESISNNFSNTIINL